MTIKIANAPVSWGVDYSDDPRNPAWEKVMTEIRQAGYSFTELGPYGYYPTDATRLSAELSSRDLSLVAGFIFQPLHDQSQAEKILAEVERICALLSKVGGRYLVLIDHISPERMKTAGWGDPKLRLDGWRFAQMIALIHRIAEVSVAHGVTPVIHQHAGCYIEFLDEIERVLAATDPVRVGICIDTGHMAYAGIDPVDFYKRHHQRVKYFHFKDIDREVHARVLAERIPFLDAVAQRIFCPLGKGVVRFPDLARALETFEFQGYATIEQDIDPAVSLNPIEDARASLNYLKSAGLCSQPMETI